MKKRFILPSYEYLHEWFTYDENTGLLTWNKKKASNTKVGGKAGCSMEPWGHVVVRIDGVIYLAHRIIWKMMLNEEPPDEIDHKDTNPRNNKWDNLRASDHYTNNHNRTIPTNNTSGIKGVCWCKRNGLWRARVVNNWKEVHLGYFATKEEAGEARRKYCEETRGEFVREGDDAIRLKEPKP